MRKGERIKADIIGPLHKADASPPCRPFLPARPSQVLAFPIPKDYFYAFTVIADLIRNL